MTVLLVARLILASAFGLAAAAKLADRRAFRKTLRVFGVPERAAAPVTLLLPAAELVVAVLLLPAGLAWYGSLAALVLLLVFTAAAGYQLARGRRPDCNCFGGLRSAPVGPAALARNAVLLALAAVVVAAGVRDAGQSATSWIDDPLVAAVSGLALLAVGQAALFVALLRRHGIVLARLDQLEAGGVIPESARRGLALGAVAPEFSLPGLDGEQVTLRSLRAAGRPVLLVFSDPGCSACAALHPQVSDWQSKHDHRVTVAFLNGGDIETNRTLAAKHEIAPLLLQRDSRVAEAYGSLGTPSAVLIGADGRVAGRLRYGEEGARALLAQALELSPVTPLPAKALALVAATSGAAVGAASAVAAGTDDDADALAEIKAKIKTWNPKIVRGATRVGQAATATLGATDSKAAKVKLLGEIALYRNDVRHMREDIGGVKVQPSTRFRKANPTVGSVGQTLRNLERMLDRFAAILRTNSPDEIERLGAEAERFALDAWDWRTRANGYLGCKGPDC